MKEMIERLKANRKPLMDLPHDEQVFLLRNLKDCERQGRVYRLRPDFEMPEPVKERWFFNTKTKKIISDLIYRRHDLDCFEESWIEITAEQKAYLETKHEGYELRKPMFGDFCIELDGSKRHVHSIPPLKTIGGMLFVKVPIKARFFVGGEK
jgi:hypothetical protein